MCTRDVIKYLIFYIKPIHTSRKTRVKREIQYFDYTRGYKTNESKGR